MAELTLRFKVTMGFERAREAFGRVATALSGACGPWVEVARESLPDENLGPSLAYRTRWQMGDATLEELCRCGSGNYRDGWGYEHRFSLDVGPIRVVYTGANRIPEITYFALTATCDAAGFRRIRRALAEALPHDRTDEPTCAVANLRSLDGLDRTLQVELLSAALAAGKPGDYGWAELLIWQGRLGRGDLDRRLREAPQDLDAWSDAAELPPDGWDAAQIGQIRARLCPWDPVVAAGSPWLGHPLLPGGTEGYDGSGWRQLDDGHGPGRARPALAHMLAEALYGPKGPQRAPSHVVGPVDFADGIRVSNAVMAVWMGGLLPMSVVTRDVTWTGHLPSTRRTAHWVWLTGDAPDDTAVLLRETEDDHELGVELLLNGAESFRTRVMRALEVIAPLPWRPVERLFEDRRTRSHVGLEGTDTALTVALGETTPGTPPQHRNIEHVVLHWRDDAGLEQHRVLRRGEHVLVGRDPSCSIRTASSCVSRRHGRFTVTDAGAHVEDLGSSGGLWLHRGSDIVQLARIKLAEGDIVQLGDLHVRIELGLRAPANPV